MELQGKAKAPARPSEPTLERQSPGSLKNAYYDLPTVDGTPGTSMDTRLHVEVRTLCRALRPSYDTLHPWWWPCERADARREPPTLPLTPPGTDPSFPWDAVS